MRRTPFGHRQGVMINNVWTIIDSSKTALAALDAQNRADGDLIELYDGSRWRFVAAGTATDAASQLVVAPSAGTGVWVRVDNVVDVTCTAVTFANADADVVYTVPAGARLLVRRGYWVNSVAWTGGSSSAIGLSSSNAGFNTKGDLQGGAAGDLTAAMGTGLKLGTIGAKAAAGIILVGGDTVRFDRITSIYTAGAGVPHLVCDVLLNPGA